MSNTRILIGDGKFKVSKEGVDVNASGVKGSDLLFDASIKRCGVIYAGGVASSNSGTAINFKSNKAELSYIPLVTYTEDNTGETYDSSSSSSNDYDYMSRRNFHKFTKTTITPSQMYFTANGGYGSSSKAAIAGRNKYSSSSACSNLSYRVLRIPCAYGYMTAANFIPTFPQATNRVLIGRNTNSNLGYSSSSPGYGIYVSKAGSNVLTCGKDDLLFSTDSGQTGTNFVSKGMYQAMPVRTVNNVPRADFDLSVSSTSTSSVSLTNFYGGLSSSFSAPVISGISSASTIGGGTSSAPTISFSAGSLSGWSASSLTQTLSFSASSGTRTIQSAILPTFSTATYF